MDLEQLRRIRKLVLIAMFADDYLMDKFVLKGGTAIDLVYQIDHRASQDVDISIKGDFTQEERREVEKRVEQSLKNTFREEGYTVFDFRFEQHPFSMGDRPVFWAGYKVEFKIISDERSGLLEHDLNKARQLAEVINQHQGKKLEVDISKYEYCEEKQEKEVDGYTIYVYTPKMLIIEKLRAICQSMSEYKFNESRTKPPRTKDFYDIYQIAKSLNVKLTPKDFDLLKHVFEIKEVPIELLVTIKENKEFHLQGVEGLRETVKNPRDLDIERCFEFVVEQIENVLSQGSYSF